MKPFHPLAPILTIAAISVLTASAAASVPTVSITASSSSISAGQSDTLTVTETSAASIHVTGSNGTSYTLPYSGGTITVSPSSTTTYTATATNSSGNATAQTTVTVGAGTTTPTVSITAKNSSISPGSSDTLTITASNAATVSVSGSDGSNYSLAASGGSITVSPSSTVTYTAVATGSSGATASAKTTVTVGSSGSAPTVSITPSSGSISAGQSDTLTVTESKASSLQVTGSNGSSYNLPYSGGAISVTPSSTTTYTATATNSHGSTTAQTTITVGPTTTNPTVSIAAANSTISAGSSDTLTVAATNATKVMVTGSDGSSYPLSASGGSVTVTPSETTTYTAEATNAAGAVASAETTVAVGSSAGLTSIQHVVFMLQENHSFDDYFGMLNPYRHANGWDVGSDGKTYDVDGIDDKLDTIKNEDDEGTYYYLYKFRTTCVDDESSAWLSSYGDVNRYDFATTRPIKMDGFVHTAEGYAKYCVNSPSSCSGNFTDTSGERAMGYYDQDYLNYYYFMASQFALSDRWFSPVSSNSIPNRIATFTGGTTQGLVYPPGLDKLSQLNINNIFEELQNAGVSWKIYYTVTNGGCYGGSACGSGSGNLPDTTFSSLTYANSFIKANPTHAACPSGTQPSSVWGDTSNYYCVNASHIAPLSQYYTDVKNNTLPAFAFIESGSGKNDEHPGSGQSILVGQAEVANIVNALMTSPSWSSSVFFFSYDEGGGPYDHVPPVPKHSNDFTDTSLGSIPDISTIAVNADSYEPCVSSGSSPTLHCDLKTSENDPGTKSTDAPAEQGFAAQLGFRLPNFVVSPFAKKHYVSHIPMDHTAVIKFVESRFISSSAHLTARDAAQPNLLDFFDFANKPWATPPTPPTPTVVGSSCQPGAMGP